MSVEAPQAATIPKRLPLFQRAWPPILLILGLVATLAWTAFLGFLLVEAARAL